MDGLQLLGGGVLVEPGRLSQRLWMHWEWDVGSRQ